MANSLHALKERWSVISDLTSVGSLLEWDQLTYMPRGGAAARGQQIGTLAQLRHEMLVSSETERRLQAAEKESLGLDPDTDDASLLRVARRDFELAARVPPDLVADLARTSALAHEPWARARAASDYSLFAPWLERLLELNRRLAACRGYKESLYDPLLDVYEPGATAAGVAAVFAELKPGLQALVRRVQESGRTIDDSCLYREYPVDAQVRFTEWITAQVGYDFEHGRQDRSVHPFSTGIAWGDTRITTRFDPHHLSGSIFASLHEAGHAMYEQGMPERFARSPLIGGASLGVHESQSQLWEDVVGRSRGFWHRYYPDLQAAFPAALGSVGLDNFYRAINRVHPSFIRVEADKVTYNFHILLRFEMEVALLDGRVSVADAPAAWNAKMAEYLGITPPGDSEGILQDTHWSAGAFGYFPTYTLGNLLAAQLWEDAVATEPDIPDRIRAGEFGSLLGWLRQNIHCHGRKYLPNDLVRRVSGASLSSEPFLRLHTARCADVYGW